MADYGDPALPERFWTKVYPEPNTGCWLWGNCTDQSGYGMYGVAASKCRRAHRVAYEALVAPVSADLVLDHLCRQRSCVNPDHLEPVTIAENNKRGVWGDLRKQCKRGHPVAGKGSALHVSEFTTYLLTAQRA